MSLDRRPLGLVTAGSLLDGLEVKLDPGVETESLRAGQFVVLAGVEFDFYAMITDVRLLSASPRIPIRPPGADQALLREVLRGESTYVTLAVKPLLQLPHDDRSEAALESAQPKTVPGHFTAALLAGEADIARVFGQAGDPGRWHIGAPLEMETPVCLDLRKLVERSNGIFGKTGTGKTFLTRLMLAGLMLKSREAVTFTFDMHNEYGFGARQEGSAQPARGLQTLFPERVVVFTLDDDSSRRRGVTPQGTVQLAYADIEPADIYAMRGEFGLSEAGCDTIGLLADRYEGQWLARLLHGDLEQLKDETGAHEGSLGAVRRKLARLGRREFPFLHRTLPATAERSFEAMLTYLAEQRKHVILEFGKVTSLLAYLLVANVLTRRIYAEWVQRSEHYHATQQPADRPPYLVICVEEAHKFLSPEAARQTSFGQIARELRKYFVSLLIVDQRPSGIDDEILSQLGTRITCQLSDEHDIQAVLAGTPSAAGLRAVLAGLDAKQQALIFGHAVPMPVVLKTRTYDQALYTSIETERRALREDVAGISEADGW